MNILKYGNNHLSTKKYKGRCVSCGSVIECYEYEVETVGMISVQVQTKCNCPVCDANKIVVS
jgi:hypothetical protein